MIEQEKLRFAKFEWKRTGKKDFHLKIEFKASEYKEIFEFLDEIKNMQSHIP